MLFKLEVISISPRTNKQPNERTLILKMSTATTPYCSVCHSAGKSKAEYTSHYLRTSKAADAKTTCPYLLAITCGYCKGQGHTPKYCPISKQKQQQQQQQPQPPTTPPAKAAATQAPGAPKKAPASARNKFALLQDVMDEDEQAEQAAKQAEQAAKQAAKQAEEAAEQAAKQTALEAEQKMFEHQKAFPLFTKATTIKTFGGLTGWAAMAAKPKAQAKPKAVEATGKVDTKAVDTKAVDTKAVEVLYEALYEFEVEATEQEYSCGYSWAD